MNSFNDNVTNQYQMYGITEALHIWNTDEKGFHCNNGKVSVI